MNLSKRIWPATFMVVASLVPLVSPLFNQVVVADTPDIPELATATDLGQVSANYTKADEFQNNFTAQGTSVKQVDGTSTTQLTDGNRSQYGIVSFNQAIDMTHTFSFAGTMQSKTAKGIGSSGDNVAAWAGDAFGFMLAPNDPSEMSNGSNGGSLGIGKSDDTSRPNAGFANAFYWGADLHYNSDKNDSKVGNPYASFRSSDSNKTLDNAASSTTDNAQKVTFDSSGQQPITMKWTPSSSTSTTVTGTLTATGWGKTWTETITTAHSMGFGAVATDGWDRSIMSMILSSFNLTLATTTVGFKGVPLNTSNSADFVAPTFTPDLKNAVIGSTVTVLRSADDYAAASKAKGFDPDYVFIAPKVAGYYLNDGTNNYQMFTVKSTTNQTFNLDYKKGSTTNVKYQYANDRGNYFKTVTEQGDPSLKFSVDSPVVAGYTPDQETVTGLYGSPDVVVTYYPNALKPRDPLNPNNTDPVTPLLPDGTVDPNGVKDTDTPGAKNYINLDYVSTMDFGSQQINSGTTYYPVHAQTFEGKSEVAPLYAQVSDLREQSGNWVLVMKPTQVINTQTGKPLNGAKLDFTSTTINSNIADKSGVTPMADQKVDLDGNDSAQVMQSTDGHAGIWFTLFGTKDSVESTIANWPVDSSVKLEVPGGTASTGAYRASIDWSLSQVPGNTPTTK